MLDVCRHSVGPGIRVDGYSYPGMVVQPYFDSLLVKYTAHHKTWDGAIRRMRRALRENHIRGVKTNIPFLLNGTFGLPSAYFRLTTITYLPTYSISLESSYGPS